MTSASNRTRGLALGFFVFVAVFAVIVWMLVRPYGTTYFFPVHFLVGLGLPFLFYAIGGRGRWFWSGWVVTALLLAWLNLPGENAGGLAPRTMDWSQVWASVIGLGLGAAVRHAYRRVRPPHRPSAER